MSTQKTKPVSAPPPRQESSLGVAPPGPGDVRSSVGMRAARAPGRHSRREELRRVRHGVLWGGIGLRKSTVFLSIPPRP